MGLKELSVGSHNSPSQLLSIKLKDFCDHLEPKFDSVFFNIKEKYYNFSNSKQRHGSFHLIIISF